MLRKWLKEIRSWLLGLGVLVIGWLAYQYTRRDAQKAEIKIKEQIDQEAKNEADDIDDNIDSLYD